MQKNASGMCGKLLSGSIALRPDRSFDDYLHDEMLRAAVERQFEIIGEGFEPTFKA